MRLISSILLLATITVLADTTPLTKAIRLENFEEAKKHITPELVNKPDSGLYHPLTYAVYTGDNDLVEQLLKAGANPNTVEYNGKTALYVAANLGHHQLVSLLIDHGASIPNTKNAKSPIAASIRAGSNKCLNILLSSFPSASLVQDWNNPPASPGQPYSWSALNYAIYHHYDDIAQSLLKHHKKHPHLQRHDAHALAYLTSRDTVSLPLLYNLLNAGINPVDIPRGAHLKPSNALDQAAARGHVNAIKIMLKTLSKESHTRAIRRAGYIAAAHDKDTVAELLFKKVQKKWPDANYLLNKAKATKQSTISHHQPRITPTNQPLLPKKSLKPAQPARTGTVAIISDPSLRNLADLINTELGKSDQLTVLHRDSMKNLISEQKIKQLNSDNAATFHRALDFIPAQNLILLSKTKNHNLIQLSLINVQSGVTIARYGTLPQDNGHDTKTIENLTHYITEKLNRISSRSNDLTAITCVPITAEIINKDSLDTASYFDLQLRQLVSETSSCVYLNRNQIHHLEIENTISNQKSYWQAAWIIDGSIGQSPSEGSTITLRATNLHNKSNVFESRKINSNNHAEIIKQCWNGLLIKMDLSKEQPTHGIKPPKNELALLTKQAEWFSNAQQPEDSLTLIHSALALYQSSAQLHSIGMAASLKTLPYDPCDHINEHPQSLQPDIKFGLLEYLDRYERLAMHTLAYLEEKNSAKTENHPLSRIDGSQHRIITTAIQQLSLASLLFNDSIIKRSYKNRVEMLTKRTNLIIQSYFSALLKTKSFTRLLHLIRDEHGYLVTHHPDVISETYSSLMASKPLLSNESWTQNLLRQASKSKRLPRKSSHIINLTKKLTGFKHTDDTINLERITYLFLQTREAKVSHTERLLEHLSDRSAQKKPPSSFLSATGELSNLMGIEQTPNPSRRYLQKPRDHQLPAGGITGTLWTSRAKLISTAEFKRLIGFYLWIDRLQKTSDKDLAAYLGYYIKQEKHLAQKQRFTTQDWEILLRISQQKQIWAKSRQTLKTLSHKSSTPPQPDTKTTNSKLYISFTNQSETQFIDLSHQAATIFQDKLWIPSTTRHKDNSGLDTPPSQHQIHVIDLKNKKIKRSITIPGNKIPVFKDSHKISIGKSHAYYLANTKSWKTGAQLYCINTNSFQIHEIKLPLSYVVSYITDPENDSVYLSLTTKRNWESRRENTYPNMVVKIQNGKLTQILSSNRRKTNQSPFDNPIHFIDNLYKTEKGIYFESNAIHGRDKPKSHQVYLYSANQQPHWENIPIINFKISLNHLSIRKNKQTQWLYKINNRDYNLVCQNSLEIQIKQPKRFSVIAKAELFPETTHTSEFKTPFYRVALPMIKGQPAQYGYKSINELIKDRNGQIQVIAKWREGFLFSINRGIHGLPAIWYIKDENLSGILTKALNTDQKN